VSPISWLIVGFAVFMGCVSLFAFVQIERNAHQARQRRIAQEQGRSYTSQR